MELEDRDIEQELEPMETEGIVQEEYNIAKQEDEEKEEEQENNYDDDTAETELKEDIMIDDIYYSFDDDVPLELIIL